MKLSKRVTITLDGRNIPLTKDNLKLIMEILAPDNLHPDWWLEDKLNQQELIKLIASTRR